MKAVLTIDMYLWKYLLPRINQDIFKSKVASFLAVSYISCYTLPRKFVLHYFFGKGAEMNVDTRSIITGNPDVYDKLVAAISNSQAKGIENGELAMSQKYVNNPKYKYSLGSFAISYLLHEGSVDIKVDSTYRFGKDNDRFTKHLHNWLVSFKVKNAANDFNISGSIWTVELSNIALLKIKSKYRKYADFRMVLV